MTGIPTTQVLLDDGTGTYPTDITARVLAGIDISSVGRTDEFSQPQAAQLSLVIDNADGGMSGGVGFGLGPFGLTSSGGQVIFPEQGIRVVETFGATTRNRFTGRITSLDLGWPGGGQQDSVINLTASDAFADLSRRPMRSMLEEEILLDAPSAYYTLSEPDGSTSAGDTSGNGMSALTITGTGAAMEFGNGTGPVDGLSAITFNGGQYLRLDIPEGFGLDGVECWASTKVSPSQQDLLGWASTAGNAAPLVSWESSLGGSFVGWLGGGVTVTGVPADGTLHHIAYVPTFGMFVDGVFHSAAATPPTIGTLYIGGSPNSAGVPWTGTIAHVALYLTAPFGRFVAHYQVGSGATETTDVRLSRLAAYAGLTATTDTPSGELMPVQQTGGQTLYTALQDVATAEGGVLFVDGSGALVMQGRYYRGLKTTADLTLGELEPGEDTAVTWDTQQKVNQVSVSRTGGATQVFPVLAVNDLVFQQSLDLAVATDADALGHAQWVVGKYTQTSPRIGSVTFRLHESPVAESLLALQIGDRISLSAMPSQLWADAGDYTVEGWSESLTEQSWTLTVNLLPWSLTEVFILDDSTFGVLDGATSLGY